jgi:hypothetical protein
MKSVRKPERPVDDREWPGNHRHSLGKRKKKKKKREEKGEETKRRIVSQKPGITPN